MSTAKRKKLFPRLKQIHNNFFIFLEDCGTPVLLLAIRLWMANIFFKSGLAKFSNMDSTILLFEYEYALPIIPPEIAAYLAVTFELACPALIAFGLLTRLATLPLIAMTLVIQFLVFENQEHFYWLFLLATTAIMGAGKISLDGMVKKFGKKSRK